ncbi:unnamed protein product [Tuber aestivum]|uniref:NB-ARC domain-containing protein n=1 Tax=Tuber aestivum TaxID=59557 RepID=A0A292PPP2_9PEZI|nr:unnamed protein product [Tuber aestivum]
MQADISGDFSGNSGDHPIPGSGSNNNMNTGYLTNVSHLRTTYQACPSRAGDREASRPHRIIPYGRNNMSADHNDLVGSVGRLCERSGPNRIALHGLGGSGKTQIALEYVHQRTGETGHNDFWVQESRILKFSEGFRAIAQHARIRPAIVVTDEGGSLPRTERWFEGPESGDWILVIDNADNDADFDGNNSPIAKFIPQGPGRGTVVPAARPPSVASRQGCGVVEIEEMGEEEALELFSKRFGSRDALGVEEKGFIAMILSSPRHVPLAIIGMAAFMTETRAPPSAYWAIFRGSDGQAKRLLSQPFCDIQREVDMTESILATYFVTFNRIAEKMCLVVDLPRLIAFFDRQNIPEELLSQPGMDDPVEFHQAIGKPWGFPPFISIRCESKTFYELHRLVQPSLQLYLPTEGTALRVIPRLSFQKRFVHLGVVKSYEGKWTLEGCEKVLGPDCPDTLSSVNNLAIALLCRVRYGESETMNWYALEWYEKILGPDHPNTLTSANNLARVLQHPEECKELETMSRHAGKRLPRQVGIT